MGKLIYHEKELVGCTDYGCIKANGIDSFIRISEGKYFRQRQEPTLAANSEQIKEYLSFFKTIKAGSFEHKLLEELNVRGEDITDYTIEGES